MANCPDIPEEFTLHWKVTNFDACFLHNHESFDSPSFSLKNFYNTRWYLRLSLESHRKYGFEYVCALVREYDEGPTSVGVSCKVSCDSNTIAEGFQTFTKGSKYDFKVPELYDFDKFPQMSSLDFKCEMYFNSGDSSNFPVFPTVSRETFLTSFTNVDKSTYTYPRQGFAASRYLVERRIFTLPFHEFELENSQKIVTLSFTETPPLSMEFSVVSEDDFEYLKINVALVEARLKSNLLLYSEVSFVDSNSETIDSGKDYHLFRRNHAKETWNFGHFFDWIQILKANESSDLLLRCQLFFFDGQQQSEILWTTNIGSQATESDPSSSIFGKEINKKEISVGTVHQTTLPFPTLSPNADKAFDLGCSNYSVSETENKMARFEHAECCLEQSELNSIATGRDSKLQIISSMNRSKEFQEENLDVNNICSVLITGECHQNKELYDSVVEFILINKNLILNSNSWVNFAKKNYELAMRILTEVCIKLPTKLEL